MEIRQDKENMECQEESWEMTKLGQKKDSREAIGIKRDHLANGLKSNDWYENLDLTQPVAVFVSFNQCQNKVS